MASPGEPSGASSNVLDQLSADLIQSPKRHYLIAPRIGRSSWPATFSVSTRDQSAAYESPHSSLLLLVGNSRRLIGPRSSGLMPQARIGRRAAPMSGLMPMPRVGRSQDLGEQEVALSTINDSALNDAIEMLVDG